MKSGKRRGRLQSTVFIPTRTHAHTHSLSFDRKAAGLLDGRQQLVVKLVVALVGRNVDPIKAGGRRDREKEGRSVTSS